MLSRRRLLELTGLGTLAPLSTFLGCTAETLPDPDDGEEPSPPPPDDPNKPWWLRKNFAPVEESESMELLTDGALPSGLAGLYLRNGPNPKHADSVHWFTGDGMVHGLSLADGAAEWYRARYVQTDVLGLTAEEVGPPGKTAHQANTSVLMYRGRVLCLEEVGAPYEVAAADLSTIGPFDFGGALGSAMTAHPKVDPVTGELFFFGAGILDANLTYHRTDDRGVLVASETLELPAAVMMHDFQLTTTHVVFMDLPILFDLDMAISGDAFPFKWSPENGSRIGVMPRYGTAADVVWIDIDTCFVFHTWNAFHDARDPNVIYLDAVRYPRMWAGGPEDFTAVGEAVRFTIDIARRTASFAPFEDRAVEFPRINPSRQGLSYRYGYGLRLGERGADGAAPAGNGLTKIDRDKGSVKTLELPEGHAADEAMFVPDPNAKLEDDGWLLSYVFDRTVNRSHLLVVDASDMTVASRVHLPVRVPHGFHGDFLPRG